MRFGAWFVFYLNFSSATLQKNFRYTETLYGITKTLLTIYINHMEKESKQEILKSMFCTSTEKPIAELEKEGWEYDLSFHNRFPEQWNDACDRVEKIKADGFYEPVLVQGQTEEERKDGVAYIYKKKTDKYKKYEKDMGYVQ
jgi:hypothetical protein